MTAYNALAVTAYKCLQHDTARSVPYGSQDAPCVVPDGSGPSVCILTMDPCIISLSAVHSDDSVSDMVPSKALEVLESDGHLQLTQRRGGFRGSATRPRQCRVRCECEAGRTLPQRVVVAAYAAGLLNMSASSANEGGCRRLVSVASSSFADRRSFKSACDKVLLAYDAGGEVCRPSPFDPGPVGGSVLERSKSLFQTDIQIRVLTSRPFFPRLVD